MRTTRDYYEILGVARDATTEDLKRAFRKKAMECHPDRNQGDPEAEGRFKELNLAYQVLSDPGKRARYDQFGEAGVSGNGAGGGFDPNGGGFDFGFGDLGDVFEAFFGGQQRAGGPQPGASLQYEVEITLEESRFGCERTLAFTRLGRCKVCEGTGSESKSGPAVCTMCAGTGRVRQTQNTFFGQFNTARPCPRCRGTGRTVTDPCPSCEGSGLKSEEVKLKLEIPAGSLEGQKLRLRGEGDAGEQGMPAGDLFVLLRFKPHELFERHNLDLHMELPISALHAMLGAELQVPTLEGEEKLDIPAGAQPGDVFRIKQKGLYDGSRNRKGDLYIHAKVVIPRKLSKEDRQQLEALRDKLEGDHEPEKASFLERIKQMMGGR